MYIYIYIKVSRAHCASCKQNAVAGKGAMGVRDDNTTGGWHMM